MWPAEVLLTLLLPESRPPHTHTHTHTPSPLPLCPLAWYSSCLLPSAVLTFQASAYVLYHSDSPAGPNILVRNHDKGPVHSRREGRACSRRQLISAGGSVISARHFAYPQLMNSVGDTEELAHYHTLERHNSTRIRWPIKIQEQLPDSDLRPSGGVLPPSEGGVAEGRVP